MKFEEVLPLIREGKKAKTSRQKEGEYYIATWIGFKKFNNLGKVVGIEDEGKWIAITKMFNDYIHSDLKNAPPFMYMADIMADDWEIVESYNQAE